jgi:3-phosphoshikimate 1-carboxyvinyltransferase
MKVTIISSSAREGVPIQSSSIEPPRFQLPPDKSILHRLLIVGSLSHSQITIPIQSQADLGEDVIATILALESLGVPIDIQDTQIQLQGVGLRGLKAPSHKINCANSGTTARLLMGLLSGQGFDSELIGDASLSQRPMKRLADVLSEGFGAKITTATSGTLPVRIRGVSLNAGTVTLPVASAQMKSAVLLAALTLDGISSILEPGDSRDHTERMLDAFGCDLWEEDARILIQGATEFVLADEFTYTIPCDISSAAFLLAGAILTSLPIRLEGVLLNPTRTRFLEVLAVMGIQLDISGVTEEWDEEKGTISYYGEQVSNLLPFQIDAHDVPLLIDEIPILAILAGFAHGESIIVGASELRHKETDRLAAMSSQLRSFGVEVEELPDGLRIVGIRNRTLSSCTIQHHGDHRIAMASAIAALRANAPCELGTAEVVRISYPGFFEDLGRLVGKEKIWIENGVANGGVIHE